MSFVAAASAVGTWAGLTGTAAVIGGGAMIGAGVGGAYSALTGDGKILDSMLTGAGIGGLAGFGLNAAGVGGAAAGTAAPGAGITGAGTTAAEVAAASNTPALAVTSNINPATGLSWEATGSGLAGGAGSPTDPSWWSTLSGGQKLATGLGATTLLGLLGGQSEGVNVPTDKGMIRPYEFSSAMRQPQDGKPYYFEPIQYDQYGKTTKPLDTSERNYFNQSYTPLEPFKAAQGGEVPQLNNMPAGGLAAIQGMREGYAPTTTFDGNIPQFALGGILSKFMGQAKKDEGLPKYSFNPETRKYTRLNGLDEQNNNANFDGDISKMLLSLNGGMGNMIRNVVGQFNPSQQNTGSGFSYDPATQRYSELANGGSVAEFSAGGVNMQDGGFVVPADTVSHFGNGSTDAGLKLLSSRLGAKPIKGRGDGMSDSISAMINGKQPARIADGEAYVPPEMVKKIGKGSPENGAKRLYKMMDKVRHARTGTKKQGKQIKADKYLPT
jgi:hypothetical protein